MRRVIKIISARIDTAQPQDTLEPHAAVAPPHAPLHPSEDVRLMSLATMADPSAQHQLMARLSGRVRRIALAVLRNPTDAEDACQISLLEILRSAGGFRGESTLERWADRIVVRNSFRLMRQRQKQQAFVDDTAEVDQLGSEMHGGGNSTARPALEYLDTLPEACRTALVLRHAYGYTVNEIAEMTGVSPNTTKDRLLRGREMARKLIRREATLDAPPDRLRARSTFGDGT